MRRGPPTGVQPSRTPLGTHRRGHTGDMAAQGRVQVPRVSLLEVFAPGLQHLPAERDRQTMLTSKPTHGGGAPLGIDLDAGVATIRITRPAPTAEGEPTTSAATTGESSSTPLVDDAVEAPNPPAS